MRTCLNYLIPVAFSLLSGVASASYQPSAPPYEETFGALQQDQYGLRYGVVNWDEQASYKLQETLELLSVSDKFSHRLKYVQGKKIVFILDDSGSMMNWSDDIPIDQYLRPLHGHQKITRWDELKQTVRSAIGIYGGLSREGVDFYFLNRGAVHDVKAYEQMEESLLKDPTSKHLTPLSDTLETVIQDHGEVDNGLVINIITDGEPRSKNRDDNNKRFEKVLKNIMARYKNVWINVRLCTDEESVVETYNAYDNKIKHIDVCDDYQAELVEVKRFKNINMTRGEYLLKTTIGAADQTPGKDNFDRWDEPTDVQCCIVL